MKHMWYYDKSGYQMLLRRVWEETLVGNIWKVLTAPVL